MRACRGALSYSAGNEHNPAFLRCPRSCRWPEAKLRALTVEIGDNKRTAVVDWHETPAVPGYAEAFDVLDGVIRQLSGGTVPYPTAQPPIVRDITPV